jgi:hypothetical protein
MQTESWFSNETKLGLGLAAGAAATLGLFALAVKFAPSNKSLAVNSGGSDVASSKYSTHTDIPREGRGDVIPMKTMQVTLSMEVPENFTRREIDALLARLKVIADPSCRYLGVDAVGEAWGATAARMR